MRNALLLPQVHWDTSQRTNGTGLGLAISKSLCESMGGKLRCKSIRGKGSTFHFSVVVGLENALGNESDYDGVMGSVLPKHSSSSTAAADGTTVAVPRVGEAPSYEQRESGIVRKWNLAVDERGKKPSIADELGQCRDELKLAAQGDLCSGLGINSDHPAAGGDTCDMRYRDESTIQSRTGLRQMAGEMKSQVAVPVESIDNWFAPTEVVTHEFSPPLLKPEQCPLGTTAECRRRRRFLVVDDVRVNRMLLRKMLDPLDVEFVLAANGAEAVQECQKTAFSVILMDVMMPVMDGLAASRAIRSGEGGGLNQTTPIIAITASPTLGRTKGNDANISDLLIKPITKDSLFGVILKWATEDDILRLEIAWRRRASASESTL